MSTRLYLGRKAHTAINPGTLGSWNNSYKQLYKMGTTKESTSFTTYIVSGLGAGTTLMRQFITLPMDAGIVFNGSTTADVVVRYQEGSSSGDVFGKYYLAIVSESGTTTRVLSAGVKDNTEVSTSLSSRKNSSTGALGTYTTVSGDRIVLELGWDKDASFSTSASISLGDNSGSDLTSSDGDTGVNNPYIDFSNTITFHAEGGGGGTTDTYDFQVGCYIQGVLDEWV